MFAKHRELWMVFREIIYVREGARVFLRAFQTGVTGGTRFIANRRDINVPAMLGVALSALRGGNPAFVMRGTIVTIEASGVFGLCGKTGVFCDVARRAFLVQYGVRLRHSAAAEHAGIFVNCNDSDPHERDEWQKKA